MSPLKSVLASVLGGALLLVGCQSQPSKSEPSPAPGPVPTSGPRAANPGVRNNAYSLLYQLLDEEKDVSKLRFIKSERPDVKQLINTISAASARGAKVLEGFAKSDASINLKGENLPPGEVAARSSIADTKKKELLGRSGEKFELTLLLSQAEALNYGWHLAEVTARNEAQPERARQLAGMGGEMEGLYRQVFDMIRLKTEGAPVK